MNKALRMIVWITYPIFLIMLSAQLLTSNPYMRLSEGLYASHDDIEYDHRYVARQLIDYLNYRHDNLEFGANAEDDSVLMRDIEIRHMVDVRDLYTLLRIVAGISLLIAVLSVIGLFFRDKSELYKTFKGIFWVPLIVTVTLGAFIAVNFSWLFVLFHEIAFDNDDWILRADDVLIQLLPLEFWMVSAILVLVFTGLLIFITRQLGMRFLKT